jgi:hypothetical protein
VISNGIVKTLEQLAAENNKELTEPEIETAYSEFCRTGRVWSEVISPSISKDFAGSDVAVIITLEPNNVVTPLTTQYFGWDLRKLGHHWLPQSHEYLTGFLASHYDNSDTTSLARIFAAVEKWYLHIDDFKMKLVNYIKALPPADIRGYKKHHGAEYYPNLIGQGAAAGQGSKWTQSNPNITVTTTLPQYDGNHISYGTDTVPVSDVTDVEQSTTSYLSK